TPTSPEFRGGRIGPSYRAATGGDQASGGGRAHRPQAAARRRRRACAAPTMASPARAEASGAGSGPAAGLICTVMVSCGTVKIYVPGARPRLLMVAFANVSVAERGAPET